MWIQGATRDGFSSVHVDLMLVDEISNHLLYTFTTRRSDGDPTSSQDSSGAKHSLTTATFEMLMPAKTARNQGHQYRVRSARGICPFPVMKHRGWILRSRWSWISWQKGTSPAPRRVVALPEGYSRSS